ncbi:MAG: ABC transporter ATP-binding protein [Candidatus Obscuribacterales bacterium]
MLEPFISVSNLTKTFGKQKAVDGVTFGVAEGEIFGLIGPNGAGKTTIMSCLVSLLRPDSGMILIDGKPPDDRTVRARCGYLPDLRRIPSTSPQYFLELHHGLAGGNRSKRKEDIEQVLDYVQFDKSHRYSMISKLSKGMRQRLLLAQAIMCDPDIFFLDEPTTGLDPPGVTMMRGFIMDRKKRGKTIIINSHHLEELETVCDGVAFIKAGKITSIDRIKKSGTDDETLRVSWLNEDVDRETLLRVCAAAHCNLSSEFENGATFAVRNRETAAGVIENLLIEEVKVVEARLGKLGLTQLFADRMEQDVDQ